MRSLFRDIRFGFRTLRNSPGMTLVAVFALTLGIGLTTTMFSIVYGALMKGLPYEDGDRIMVLARTNAELGITQQNLPLSEFYDYREQLRSFSGLSAYTSGTMNVSGTDRAERFDGSWVTANSFSMLGVEPDMGRNFQPGDDELASPDVAMLSNSIWRTRYGSDSAIVGKVIRVNGVQHEVIGVMPEGFAYPNNDRIWLPLKPDPVTTARNAGRFIFAVGKLKPDVSLTEASADVQAVAERLQAAYPETNENFNAIVMTFMDRFLGDQPRQLLLTMLGAVFFVLLIACSNVANLLLDRAAHRTREVGIRTALGATRGAVVALFLAESFVLASIGTVFGVVLAYFGVGAFNGAIADQNRPFFVDISLHPQVLLFTIGVALLATFFSGIIPAIQASRADINEILKDESRGASNFKIGRLSKALVMFEIALSCGLLVAAGLMVKSVAKLRLMNPGFETESVFTARVGFPVIYTDTVMMNQFFRDLNERVAALPGVTAAAVSSGLPGARQGMGGSSFGVEGTSYATDQEYPTTRTLAVSPGFFETVQLPLKQGRLLNDGDQATTVPVIVVTERFVRDYMQGEEVVGRRIRFGTSQSTAPWLTIVGVVGDVYNGDNEDPFSPAIIRPFSQARSNFAYISARTGGPPLQITSAVRDEVNALNQDIPIYWPMTLKEAIAEPTWFIRVFGTMFMILGFVALFLASVGLYAVMSFSVSRRSREVGVRMALGAQAADVVRMIFRQGLVQLLVGLTLGMALAFAISQVMSVVLFDVQPRDPVVFGGVIGVLVLTGVVACLVPSRRATHVDPVVALRAD